MDTQTSVLGKKKQTATLGISPKMEGSTIQHFLFFSIQHFPSKWLLQKAFFSITCTLLKMAAIFVHILQQCLSLIVFTYQSPRSLFSRYLWLEKLMPASTKQVHCSSVHSSENMQVINMPINTVF